MMTKNLSARRVFAYCFLSVLSLSVSAASRFVSFSSGDVLLNREPVVSIYVSSADLKGVSLAADNLASDLAAVDDVKRVVRLGDRAATTNANLHFSIG